MVNIINQLGFEEEISQPTQNLADGSENSRDSISVEEIAVSASSVQDAARNSLDFLAALALPGTYKYAFPPVYLSVWDWLLGYIHKSRDFSKLALGLPRGFGKTLLVKIFILYCILFTNRKFILILCETQSKANNIIADIVDALNEPNIRNTFGAWNLGIETDRQDLKKFGYRGRNIILMGAGADSGIRGITLKNERPDVMVFDDIQSRDCADSQIQSDKLEREMVGTAMKAKSPHGCLYLFIANMYPTKWSILRKLKHNPTWIKFIAGGILADGTSLWEELQPIEQLKEELRNDIAMGRPEIFFSEVLNDENASSNYLIDLTALPPLPYSPEDIPNGNFILIDPATDKLGADAVSVGYFEVYDGYPVLKKVSEGRFSPGDTIREALKFCFEHNCRLVAIEANAYQYSLNYWFRFICEQKQIYGIEAVEVYSGSLSKNSRIISMLKAYAAGEIYIDPEARAAAHLQISQFNPLKKDNTDGILDLLTYAPRVMEMYGEYVQITNVLLNQEGDNISVLPPELNCAF
jgi:hypothetical protein